MTARTSGSAIATVALALAASLLPLVFCPMSHDSIELPKLVVLRGLLVLGIAGYLARPRAIPRSPVVWAAMCLGAIEIVATALSVAPAISLSGAYYRYAGLMRTADWLFLFLLACAVLGDAAARRTLARAATVAATLAAVYGIAQHLGLEPGRWDVSDATGNAALRYRSFATLGSPSFLGLYLAMAIPLACALATSRDERARAVWVLSAGLLATCLVLTYSRAAWAAAVIGMGVSTLCSVDTPRARVRSALLVLAVGAAIGLGIAAARGAPSPAHRAVMAADVSGGSVQVRRELWRGAIRMLATRPVLGWGPGMFRYTLARFASAGMSATERRNPSAHNELLDHAAETGVLGAMAYLALFVAGLVAARRACRGAPDGATYAGVLAAGVIGVQFGFHCLATGTLWWIALGAVVAIVSRADASHAESALSSTRLLVACSACALLAWTWSCARTIRWFVADVRCQDAQSALDEGRPADAEAMLLRATSNAPSCDVYWLMLADAQRRCGQDPVPAYRAAISANPASADNRFALAATLGYANPASLPEWQAAVTLDPQSAEARNELGNALCTAGRWDEAAQSFHQALGIRPGWRIPAHNLEVGERHRARRR